MAKILVLNGSPHKSASTTMAVTNAFVKGMCEGGEYESEIINISDLNVTPVSYTHLKVHAWKHAGWT